MPWTPPPGSVEEEQRKTPGSGVVDVGGRPGELEPEIWRLVSW